MCITFFTLNYRDNTFISSHFLWENYSIGFESLKGGIEILNTFCFNMYYLFSFFVHMHVYIHMCLHFCGRVCMLLRKGAYMCFVEA